LKKLVLGEACRPNPDNTGTSSSAAGIAFESANGTYPTEYRGALF
jgi:hypothetical protein